MENEQWKSNAWAKTKYRSHNSLGIIIIHKLPGKKSSNEENTDIFAPMVWVEFLGRVTLRYYLIKKERGLIKGFLSY